MYDKNDMIEFAKWWYGPDSETCFPLQAGVSIEQGFAYWNGTVRDSSKKSSTNLPSFEEILKGCQPPFGKQSSRNYISGMQYMYNFIAGKIGR